MAKYYLGITPDDFIPLIKSSVSDAIEEFSMLTTKDKAFVLLHLLDNNPNVNDLNYREFMLKSEALLKCIKIANKAIQGDDKKLVEMAVDLYSKLDSDSTPTLEEELKRINKPKVKSNYYLLIKKIR